MPCQLRIIAVASILVFVAMANGEVVRFEITSRQSYADGRSFGKTGAYEKIVGRVHFAIDPDHQANGAIVDLSLAPRNARGQVEFSSDLVVLAPQNPAKSNGAVLYDVNNRGGKLALRFFNDAAGGNAADDPGNEFLFWRGYTVVWSGWIGELLPGDGRLQLRAPVARGKNVKPVTGRVRYEICPESAGTKLSLARPGHGAYRPTNESAESATLSIRQLPHDLREPIPRHQFRIVVTESESPTPAQLPLVELELPGGFQKGFLYELIYEARDPLVHGVCFASVRDLIAAFKNGDGKDNPLAGDGWKLARAHGFGVSQSGRFLREFVYAGFNIDEKRRMVFDGLIPHVAGGGLGSFNHRFAQPTTFATQHEQHDWPTDRFPFAYEEQTDPFTNRADGILNRCTALGCVPKIFHTQSSTEYWSRAGSLVHTDPRGRRDATIPANVRMYAFGGTQHGPANWPVEKGAGQAAANPGDYRPFLRSLLDKLDRWCRTDREPPPSVYPMLSQETLALWQQPMNGFPKLPGIQFPKVIREPSLLDFGEQWSSRGIVGQQPPTRISDYTVLVPRCDADGNERGCLLPPEVAVPLATFTGWAVRGPNSGAEGELVGLNGSYIPFAKTTAERVTSGDPRRAIGERYRSLDDYLAQLENECRRLRESGYLLKEDVVEIVRRQRERAEPLFAPTE